MPTRFFHPPPHQPPLRPRRPTVRPRRCLCPRPNLHRRRPRILAQRAREPHRLLRSTPTHGGTTKLSWSSPAPTQVARGRQVLLPETITAFDSPTKRFGPP